MILIPLLFQFRDFSNCFSVCRRLFDSIEHSIFKTSKLKLPEEKEDFYWVKEEDSFIMCLGQKRLSSLSPIY